jgi:hypothetical protein
MSIDIILVYSGNIFPYYLLDTIKLLKKYEFNIHIIIEYKFHHLIKDTNCKIIYIEDLRDFRYDTYSIQNYNTNFRDNFFTRTSSRFILLDNYITQKNITSCFHIENDIVLFSNLKQIKIELDKIIQDTAIIMDHPQRCVPSFIWFRDKSASNKLANFIYDNNYLDDMKNLAKYYLQNKNTIINLPILPFDLIDQDSYINFGNKFDIFQSIFDGAAIGQYLYGIDSEHNKQNTAGFINETSILKPNQYNIFFENKEPYMEYMQQKIKINNLHIHSKNLYKLL